MSKKEGYSRKGLFGEIKHYDANGRKIGESRPNILGGYVLGRLFAYAPKTADGHYPCEAVCQIIEEYGDESLLSEYRCELFNKRGIFSPSAGRAEKDIAEGYKDNADFLSIKYPKTADVFFKMSQRYVYDSDLERRRAENGYF